MSDRIRTLISVVIISAVLLLAVVLAGSVVLRRSVVSPVPEESPIRIIIMTPAPEPSAADRTAQ